jgi:hypothetical protein
MLSISLILDSLSLIFSKLSVVWMLESILHCFFLVFSLSYISFFANLFIKIWDISSGYVKQSLTKCIFKFKGLATIQNWL